MNNQFVSPLIKEQTQDTLLYVSCSLTYLLETVGHIPPEEITNDGLAGLRHCLETIRHAISFEMERVGSISPNPRMPTPLNNLEARVFQSLTEHLIRQTKDDKIPS